MLRPCILSALKAQPERNTVITTNVEHPTILTLCEWLEKEGYIVHKLKVDKKGRIDMDEYKSLLNDRVAIVSVMWANNETGTIFLVVEMAELAPAKGIIFHTDAVQAVGKISIDLKTCSRSPATSCMRQRVSVCSICVAVAVSVRCCAVVIRNVVVAPAPKTRRPSSVSAWPANSPCNTWPRKTAQSNACATSWKAAC